MNILEKDGIVSRVYFGNCMDVLKTISSAEIDMLITDPPYGMNYQSNMRKDTHKKIMWDDNLDWLDSWSSEVVRVCKSDAHLYIFCSWHNVDIFKSTISKYAKVKNILIWDKQNFGMGDLEGDFAPSYEMILFCSSGDRKLNGRRVSNIIKTPRTANLHHPTEKPVALNRFFIEKSCKPGDIVLDTFAGSQSSRIAAMQCGVHYVGMEIDEEYFVEGNKRFKSISQQMLLF